MSLVISSLQASLILLAALAVCRIARGRSAAFRSMILTTAIAAASAVPLFAAAAPRLGLIFRLPEIPSPAFLREVQLDTAPAPTDVRPALIEAPSVSAPAGDPAPSAAARTRQGFAGTAIPQLWPFLRGIWFAGVVLGMWRILFGMVRLKRIGRVGGPALPDGIEAIAAETRQRYGLKRPVTILVRSGEAPVTWGVLRPKLLLPAEAREWTGGRLRIVMAHEFAHIRRADWVFQVFAEIQRAVFWFNPLWWIAVRRLVEEGERAADDVALTAGIDGVDNTAYAEELLALARTFATPRAVPGALAMARNSVIERRFAAIVSSQSRREAVTRRAAAVMGGAFAILMLGIAAGQPAATGSISPAPPVAVRGATGPEPGGATPVPVASQVAAPALTAPAVSRAAAPAGSESQPVPSPASPAPEKVLLGRVGFDDGATLPVGELQQFQVILTSASGRRVTQPYTNTQGIFAFRIAPEKYAVTLTPLRLGYCLKSATYGATDLTRAPLVLKPDADDTQIQVILTRTCPAGTTGFRISGRVTDWPPRQARIRTPSSGSRSGRGSPPLRPTLSLSAAMTDRPKEFFDIYSITPRANGAFDIDGVPPGHYAIKSSSTGDAPLVSFDVAGKDVSGIEVNLTGEFLDLPVPLTPSVMRTISGVVDFGNGAIPQFSVQFVALRAGTAQTVKVSGREFSVPLAEGEYRVRTPDLPPGFTVRATAGPLDVAEPFLVTSKGIADLLTGIPVKSTEITIKLGRTTR
ncbi:MAG TPA: M56 family metallopeptidase [Terriglobia bacterium]|nr:M56 family metallopeptidase [Terriglobia bacterium]